MSELRQDLVSGDWIIMASERFHRPYNLLAQKKLRLESPKSTCPFEKLDESGNWPPISVFPPLQGRSAKDLAGALKNWKIVLIPNKYPALAHIAGCAATFSHGPNSFKNGSGEHDLLITRDHYKNFAWLDLDQATRVFQVLQDRYRALSKDRCNVYTSAFANWGPSAGASIFHPHYQVITLPIIPPDIEHSIQGSRKYFEKHGRCPHCVMLKFDVAEKKRVIAENGGAIAIVPYASREPFEVMVFPKKHLSYFEQSSPSATKSVAAVLQAALKKIHKQLNDPDYNFFIHTAPLKGKGYGHYHWHIEILPKITELGGFELSTGVDINVVDPSEAASMLRGGKKSFKK